MSKKSNNQGRAFEFACLNCLYNAITKIRQAMIVHNSSYDAAERAWRNLSDAEQALYQKSAESTIDTLFSLEPNMIETDDDTLQLYIQNDRHGEVADVRDIIIERKNITWEVGFSIKHNHEAVKHSRLSKNIDFGYKWYATPCSNEYWESVSPIFAYLDEEKKNRTEWHSLPDKEEKVYLPLLKAFKEEIIRQYSLHPDLLKKLVEYLLSKYDFYKIVSVDNKLLTTIQSFNIYGTLNSPSKTKKPTLAVPIIDLPTKLLYCELEDNSQSTLIMCLDNGWQFSFRIHNARTVVEPSLKFDIQLVGMPASINIKFNCNWKNN